MRKNMNMKNKMPKKNVHKKKKSKIQKNDLENWKRENKY